MPTHKVIGLGVNVGVADGTLALVDSKVLGGKMLDNGFVLFSFLVTFVKLGLGLVEKILFT